MGGACSSGDHDERRQRRAARREIHASAMAAEREGTAGRGQEEMAHLEALMRAGERRASRRILRGEFPTEGGRRATRSLEALQMSLDAALLHHRALNTAGGTMGHAEPPMVLMQMRGGGGGPQSSILPLLQLLEVMSTASLQGGEAAAQPDHNTGALQREIELLPTRAVRASETTAAGWKEKGSEQTECQICLESYAAGEQVRTLPCFHFFHSACIDQCLVLKKTCPICRTSIRATHPETACLDEAGSHTQLAGAEPEAAATTTIEEVTDSVSDSDNDDDEPPPFPGAAPPLALPAGTPFPAVPASTPATAAPSEDGLPAAAAAAKPPPTSGTVQALPGSGEAATGP